MSALSLFALLVAPFALKPKKPDVEPAELIAEISALKVDNADLRRELATARDDYDTLRAETARWRERALSNIPAPQPLAGFGQAPDYAALQQAAAAMQSQAAQNNQRAPGLGQFGQLGQAMGLLGAQNLIDAELWCNCVPSRAQVWAANG